ncbi:hypothetical protein [Hahella ganghwensis]|uniref:hypothetical protein n=1 Tax=Hahella ganghwensis TaxID=286420 RepID=UPI0003A2F7FB|nr:hypothetical protein [Hahella ganghwensis]
MLAAQSGESVNQDSWSIAQVGAWLAVFAMAVFATLNIKGEDQIVKVRYLQHACENCYHLKVEAATDVTLVERVIVPASNNLEVSDLIAEAVNSGESLCLYGSPYLFNFDPVQLEPEGIRFYVKARYLAEQCQTL